MPKTDETAGLPAPISLTFDEAREVAGGTLSIGAANWWWFGQPANPYVISGSQFTNPVTVGMTQLVGFGG